MTPLKKTDAVYTAIHSAHKKHRVWQQIVTVLACFVVFCTTYALILPAITMETSTDPNPVFCGDEEHNHTLICYSDPEADLETEDDWTGAVSELDLVNVWSRDLVNVALSQHGYRESSRNFLVSDEGERQGYSRYGAWNEDAYGDWNAAFVGWCMEYAGITGDYVPYFADHSRWLSAMEDLGLLCDEEYTPQRGDIAFSDTDGDGETDRVGIVTDCNDSYIMVIEGDLYRSVAQLKYTDDSAVKYARLDSPYRQHLEDNGLAGPEEYAVPIYTDRFYTDLSGESTVITLEGVLPLDATPRAYPVKASLNGYSVVCSYDISIWLSDGTLYEPNQYVTVSIEKADIPSSSAVYYVPDDGMPEKMTSRPGDDGVCFDADHFSVYAVVGTSPEEITDLNERPVSDSATGFIKNFISDITEIRGNYYSDKVTANIESEFSGILEDDGKLITDKSVLYNGNDYYTFENYGSDEFSVTLSALAQQYAQNYEIRDKAPVDVVMILDISGSMESIGTNNEKRIDVATEALNYFINNLMLLHPENRVGIVVFANSSEVFLPLGRYYVGSGAPSYSGEGTVPSYITCNSGGCTVNNSTYSGIATNSALRRVNTDGKGNYVSSVSVTSKAFCDYGGTFTQSGIARAAEMFLSETNLTYTSTTGDVIKRMPVTLLLSDGEPTFCTEDYTDVLNGDFHGSGIATDTTNPKGIQGYYTILSANYYKGKITDHYQYTDKNGNIDSYFYSVGMGINATGVDAAESSTNSGDHYKRAVLNPHPEEVALLTDTSANNYTINAYQLYQLLGNTYSGSSISIGSTGYSADSSNGYTIMGTSKTPTANVPVSKNPYTDYAYADDGFFSSEYTKLELAEVMDTILVNMMNNDTYIKSFPDSVSNLNFYDKIGNGMQITGDFILRYNGLDYAVSKVSEEGNVTKYQYVGTETVYAYVGSENAYPLSDIKIEVVANDDGTQTVHWFIPAVLVPELAYYQGMNSTDYYQMYPVRLIYKVGLSDESKDAVSNLSEGDSPLVFYTNAWEDTVTYVKFHTNDNNPYYQNRINLSQNKEINVSGTRSTYYESHGATDITDSLGNNGKLVFEYRSVVPDTEGELTNFKADKVWSDGNENHSDDSVGLSLLADGVLYGTAALNEANDWTYIWKNIPKYYTNGEPIDYTVKEIKLPGYQSVVGAPSEDSFVADYEWNNITSFTSGDTVRIVYNGNALANQSGSALTMVAVDENDETQQWTLGTSGSSFTLRNKSTGRYLYASRSGNSYTVSASTSSNAWTLNNMRLRSASYTNRYISINATSGAVSMASSGTTVQPQSLDEITLNGMSVTVTNNKLTASTTTEMIIEKQWLNPDGSPDSERDHDPVTVTLFADGDEYLTVTLSADNGWKTTVADLPVSWSVTPDTPIKWTFEESEVMGYYGVFGDIQENTVTNTVFTDKNGFTNGEAFFITDNSGNALTASGSSVTASAMDPDNDYQKWTAASSGNYFSLRNVGTGTYLYLTRSGYYNNYTYSLGLNSSSQQWQYTGSALRSRAYTSYYLTLDNDSAGVATSGAAVTVGQYENEDENVWQITLTNRSGMELPATGGDALYIYGLCGVTVLGGCLAGCMGYRKKRLERSK